jgi:hypothetical protein
MGKYCSLEYKIWNEDTGKSAICVREYIQCGIAGDNAVWLTAFAA